MDKIEFAQSGTYKEKASSFVAYAACVQNVTEVRNAYYKAKQLSPDADHIMVSYAIKHHSGHHDDSEHGASKRLLSILQDRNARNMAVFVARYYGGLHLGPKRFVYIEKAAKEAFNLL